jgi:hypothetical protein
VAQNPRESVLNNDALLEATGYKIRYHPKGAVKEYFSCRDDEVLLAGPAGTGKTLGILHKLHLAMSKYKEAKAFISRKTRASMTNSCLATFDKHVLKPPDKVIFHKQDQQYRYPNGSLIAVIGLDDPERIKSTDWDMGFINEATECTENDAEIATTRLRNWTMPYQQLVMDCNPDKPTHWLKRRCDQGLCKMLISRHTENPRLWDDIHGQWTREGQQYMAKLQRLTGVRLIRLYKGEWVAAEGVVYEKWDAGVHMLSVTDLPADWTEWPHFWSIDWGFNHPFVWQDWMEDPKGRLYLNRQIYRTHYLVEDAARDIMELMGNSPHPYAVICDHDLQDRASFERHTGLLTLPAYKHIQQGIQAVQKRLEPIWSGRPGLFILRDSLVDIDRELETAGKPTKTEDEWDGYVWDEKITRISNSRKDELPVDKDNHGMDACTWGKTEIATARGHVPIPDVRIGDLVLTRQGLKPVLDAGMTNRAARVVRVLLSDGRELVGTCNHYILIDGQGWKRLDALRYADAILDECDPSNWRQESTQLGLNDSGSTGLSTEDTRTPRTSQIGSTSDRVLQRDTKGTPTCTLMCGSSTEGTSQLGMRSTIMTGIPRTTGLATFAASAKRHIGSTMSLMVGRGLRLLGSARRLARELSCSLRRQIGIGLQRAGLGIRNMLGMSWLPEMFQLASASYVEHHISSGGSATGSALPCAEVSQDVTSDQTMLLGSACSVTEPTWQASTLGASTAPVHVLSVTELDGLYPVYNLTVAESPEYFANGVLVHNCRYAVAFADSLADDPEDIEETLMLGEDYEESISPY